MNAAERKRLERVFDGSATLEDVLELERSAVRSPDVAAALHEARALRAALETSPEPPVAQLDVERLVRNVAVALDAAPESISPAGPRAPVRVGLAAAATVLALAGGWWFLRAVDDAQPSPVDVHVASAAAPTPIEADAAPKLVQEPVSEAPPLSPGVAALVVSRVSWTVPGKDSGDVDGDGAATLTLAEALRSAGSDGVYDDNWLQRVAAAFADHEARAAHPHAADAPSSGRSAAGLGFEASRLAALAVALCESDDAVVAEGAIALIARGADARAVTWLSRALARELEACSAGSAAAERALVRRAAVRALIARGGAAAVAQRFEALAAAGHMDAATLEAVGSSLPADFAPRSEPALLALVQGGRTGADVLARLALDAPRRGAPELDVLAALARSPFGAAAVEDLVRGMSLRGGRSAARLERALELVRATDAVGAADWLGSLVRRGQPRALETLAALSGAAPLDVLLALEFEGLVRDERVWTLAAERDPGRIAAVIEGGLSLQRSELESLVARLIASGSDAAAVALASAAAAPELSERARERAALALAERSPLALAPQDRTAVHMKLAAALRGAAAPPLGASTSVAGAATTVELAAALLTAAAVWFPAEELAAELQAAGFTNAERLAGLAATGAPHSSVLALQARFEHSLGGALGARRARPKE